MKWFIKVCLLNGAIPWTDEHSLRQRGCAKYIIIFRLDYYSADSRETEQTVSCVTENIFRLHTKKTEKIFRQIFSVQASGHKWNTLNCILLEKSVLMKIRKDGCQSIEYFPCWRADKRKVKEEISQILERILWSSRNLRRKACFFRNSICIFKKL